MDQSTGAETNCTRRRRRWLAAVCAALLVAVTIVFSQTPAYDFVNFDDDVYVYFNSALERGFGGDGLTWAFTTFHAGNWHPVTWLSLMLDWQLCGGEPWGYHLTNVALHAAAVALLFLVLERMTGDLWPSALAAALFAVHPLRVESVAWVAERKDVLSGLFFMLTLGRTRPTAAIRSPGCATWQWWPSLPWGSWPSRCW